MRIEIEHDGEDVDVVEVKPWDRARVAAQFREAMGPHQKAELAIDLIAARFELLWEARQLNLARIDRLRREVQELRQRMDQKDEVSA